MNSEPSLWIITSDLDHDPGSKSSHNLMTMKTLMKWAIADYHRLIELDVFANRQVELLAGEIIAMPPEGAIHAYTNDGISTYLRQLLTHKAWIRAAHPITLTDSEPQPDIAICRLPRQLYRDRHPYPEDLYWLIEISQSTLDYDLIDKKRVYAQARIQEYWVVDINHRQLFCFRQPEGTSYQQESCLTDGIICPLTFPELAISLDKFWD
jgi:Uma2 family endonuclease